MSWDPGSGLVEFPDGTRLRGRGLRNDTVGAQRPEWGVFLLGSPPRDVAWPHRWVRWREFWLPSDRTDARDALAEASLRAAAGARVEIACSGGRGRTGTAIACIAQLHGVPGAEALRWTREHYDRHAAETPWQRRYVRRFTTSQ